MPKPLKKLKWNEWLIIILIVLMIVTNLYWALLYNNLRISTDNNAETAYNALAQSAALKACLDQNIKPCNTPPYQHFSVPKGY
jgi:uncharacterized protein YpmB